MRNLLIGLAILAITAFVAVALRTHTVSVVPASQHGSVATPVQSTCISFHNDLRYGSTDRLTGGEVSLLQRSLRDYGFLNSAPTGFFGRMTEQGVKTFQRSVGVTPVGFVGPLTRAKIRNVTCGEATQTTATTQSVVNPPTHSVAPPVVVNPPHNTIFPATPPVVNTTQAPSPAPVPAPVPNPIANSLGCTPTTGNIDTNVLGIGSAAGFEGGDSKYILDLGVKWLRAGIGGVPFPSPGVYNWEESDNTIAAANKAGIKLLSGVGGVPNWVWTKDRQGRIDEISKIVTAVATRYKGKLRYYEIYNEPNLSGMGFWPSNKSERDPDYVSTYLDFLAAANRAIHKADPSAVVVIGGLAEAEWANMDPFAFMKKLYELGGKDCFDVFTYHPYASGGKFKEKADAIRAGMARYGDSTKPIWFAEIGANTPEEQVRLMNQMKNEIGTVPGWFWFSLRDWGMGNTSDVQFGLLTLNFQKRPAYDLFKQIVKSIVNPTPANINTPSPTVNPTANALSCTRTTGKIDTNILGIGTPGTGLETGDYEAILDLNVKWLRDGVEWAFLEPTEAAYSWQEQDNVVKLANKYNVNLLLINAVVPDWVWNKNRQGRIDAVYKLYDNLATRYKGKVRYYEIFNEPNLVGMFYPGGRGITEKNPDFVTTYLDFLAAANRAIHKVDPSAVVVIGGLAESPWANMDPFTYMKKLYELRGKDCFDVFAYHPYASGAPYAPAGKFGEKAGEIREFMKRYGDGAKPIWFNELGASESNQVELMNEMNAELSVVPAWFWFAVRDWNSNPDEMFGLLTLDLQKRPAYDVFKQILKSR